MVVKILSGGQTGVDRAGLDFAIENGVCHGGYCPKGRKAVDGRIPEKYKLIQTLSDSYAERTEKNLLDSEGTLIFYFTKLSGGTRLTYKLCKNHGKKVFCVDLDEPELFCCDLFKNWALSNKINVLNIAGPRENKKGTVYPVARKIINKIMPAVCGL